MTTKTDDQRCQNCRYFHMPPRGNSQCRRYPPNAEGIWPLVYFFDPGCGEWAAEGEETEDHPPIRLHPDSPEHEQFHYCPTELPQRANVRFDRDAKEEYDATVATGPIPLTIARAALIDLSRNAVDPGDRYTAAEALRRMTTNERTHKTT